MVLEVKEAILFLLYIISDLFNIRIIEILEQLAAVVSIKMKIFTSRTIKKDLKSS